MSLIDQFMPSYSLRQIDRVPVAADARRAYQVVRQADFYRIGWARALFGLRLLPEKLLAWFKGQSLPLPRTSRIEDFTRQQAGFRVLAEEPGREIVVGAIGRVWKPHIEFAEVAAHEFAAFNQPGFIKVAWCLQALPRAGGGSCVAMDVRVIATDPESWVRFTRYWFLIGRFSHWLRKSLLRSFKRELDALGAPPSSSPVEQHGHAARS